VSSAASSPSARIPTTSKQRLPPSSFPFPPTPINPIAPDIENYMDLRIRLWGFVVATC
jgi:hypothetical protein